MENEQAILDAISYEVEDFDLDALEELDDAHQSELESQYSELNFLESEKELIGNPDLLVETVMNVVFDQFMNQVAITAGEEFIKENHNRKLDLRNEAHIQTTENFAKGKFATHNTEINYEKRYDDWQNSFQKNEDGSIRTKTDHRTGEERAVLRTRDKKKDPSGLNYNTNFNAREFIDSGRPTGSKTIHKDHTISAAEIIRDPKVAAHMTREEQAAFANSDINLIDLDSRANPSKSDSSMTEWLDSERTGKGAGLSQAEYFGLDEEELRARDKNARKEYENRKNEAEQRSIESGKKTQKQEFYRISGKALRTALLAILASLVKEIAVKLILWLKSAQKNVQTLLDYIKSAILSFVGKLKGILLDTGESVLTTIATSIVGPVVGVVKKTISLLKQGWRSLKEAIQYLRDPANKGKPLKYLLPEVGKIVIAGLSGVGAMVLGEFLEAALSSAAPFLAVDIPVLGSPANLIGSLMGAIISGVIGAIAINLIDKYVSTQQKADNLNSQIDKKNDILNKQNELMSVKVTTLYRTKQTTGNSVVVRHRTAGEEIRSVLDGILTDEQSDNQSRILQNKDALDALLQM